jgi:hypothetical protein
VLESWPRLNAIEELQRAVGNAVNARQQNTEISEQSKVSITDNRRYHKLALSVRLFSCR